jgi:hypothetical protein
VLVAAACCASRLRCSGGDLDAGAALYYEVLWFKNRLMLETGEKNANMLLERLFSSCLLSGCQSAPPPPPPLSDRSWRAECCTAGGTPAPVPAVLSVAAVRCTESVPC